MNKFLKNIDMRGALFDHLVGMARFCDDKSPFMASLLRSFSSDELLSAVHDVVGHLQGNLQLVLPGTRLAGGLNYLVVSKQDEALAGVFPPRQLVFDSKTKVEVLRVLKEHQQQLISFSENAPQTNEVRRSGALMCGLAVALQGIGSAALLELGSSSGLNLLLDRFVYEHIDNHMLAEKALRLPAVDWVGEKPKLPSFSSRIVSRRGCDLNPIDLRSQEGFCRGLSYIWPDQLDRVAIFKEAVEMLRKEQDLVIEKQSAEVFLENGRNEICFLWFEFFTVFSQQSSNGNSWFRPSFFTPFSCNILQKKFATRLQELSERLAREPRPTQSCFGFDSSSKPFWTTVLQ
jgi:hypothetical protein